MECLISIEFTRILLWGCVVSLPLFVYGLIKFFEKYRDEYSVSGYLFAGVIFILFGSPWLLLVAWILTWIFCFLFKIDTSLLFINYEPDPPVGVWLFGAIFYFITTFFIIGIPWKKIREWRYEHMNAVKEKRDRSRFPSFTRWKP